MSLLSAAGRAALPRFQYRGTDHSFIYRYVTTHIADALVHRCTPRWAAPNAITFAGLLLQVAALAVALRAAPDFAGAAAAADTWPSAAAASALLAAVCLLAYSTLDNMDGKQARRTGSASPLGLIFDHGCDAVNAALVGWAAFALHVCHVGPAAWQTLALWVIPTLPFFLNTWEEFHVGALVLPVLNGPNEGLTLTIGLLVATALAPAGGRALWAAPPPGEWLKGAAAALRPVSEAAAAALARDTLPPLGPQGPSLLDFFVTLSLSLALATAAYHMLNVAIFELRGGRGASGVGTALLRQAPVWALYATAALWLRSAPCRAVVGAHWGLFYATGGCLYVDLVVRLMVAHVCEMGVAELGTRAVLARVALFAAAPLALAAAELSGRAPGAEAATQLARLSLLASFAAAALSLLAFAAQTLRDIVEVLDVDVFSIERQVARLQGVAPPLKALAGGLASPAGARRRRQSVVSTAAVRPG